jgi:hypothetical protein
MKAFMVLICKKSTLLGLIISGITLGAQISLGATSPVKIQMRVNCGNGKAPPIFRVEYSPVDARQDINVFLRFGGGHSDSVGPNAGFILNMTELEMNKLSENKPLWRVEFVSYNFEILRFVFRLERKDKFDGNELTNDHDVFDSWDNGGGTSTVGFYAVDLPQAQSSSKSKCNGEEWKTLSIKIQN